MSVDRDILIDRYIDFTISRDIDIPTEIFRSTYTDISADQYVSSHRYCEMIRQLIDVPMI
jgi:hypothetical protein